jgi:hypothetical protein
MNIMDFNKEEILCVEGLGDFLDQTLNICLSTADEFVESLDIKEDSEIDDRSYNTEFLIPRIKLD